MTIAEEFKSRNFSKARSYMSAMALSLIVNLQVSTANGQYLHHQRMSQYRAGMDCAAMRFTGSVKT